MTDFAAVLYTSTNETPSHSYTVFPRIIAGGGFFFQHRKGVIIRYIKGGDYSRDAIIANIVQ